MGVQQSSSPAAVVVVVYVHTQDSARSVDRAPYSICCCWQTDTTLLHDAPWKLPILSKLLVCVCAFLFLLKILLEYKHCSFFTSNKPTPWNAATSKHERRTTLLSVAMAANMQDLHKTYGTKLLPTLVLEKQCMMYMCVVGSFDDCCLSTCVTRV